MASFWRLCKDELPETNDEVLTTYYYDDNVKKRFVETASHFEDDTDDGHWVSVWDEFKVGHHKQTVVAWAPMPKPYMGDLK